MTTVTNYLLTGTLGLFLLGLSACSESSGNKAGQAKSVQVKTMKVNHSDDIHPREYIGVVESENTVDLSFQVNGNIEKVFAREGEHVKKNQLLARLNTATFENSYKAAKATLVQARDAFERFTEVYNNNSLPEIKYQEIKSAFEQAEANEKIARKNLDDCFLYSPFSGVIGQKMQEEGANVMPGSPVFRLMNISTVKVRIAIPENDISSVHMGETCKVKISALDNAPFDGKVTEKGVVAHSVSHTYDIKVQISNSGGIIMPGMVVKSYLYDKDTDGGIVIPLKAVQVDFSGENFVWIVDNGNKAVRKQVKIGELIGNGIRIKEGILSGDMLVIEGYQNLSPGVTVQSI